MLKKACPVECKYCSVTDVAYRSIEWVKQPCVSINKVVTILNFSHKKWPPKELFLGDVLGFEASSDPFFMDRFDDFKYFCNEHALVARIATFVTKMPITKHHIPYLVELNKKVPVALVFSITGLDHSGIEKVKLKSHLRNIEIANSLGIECIALMHPYIQGLSDLNALYLAEKAGCKYYQIKGFRYSSNMDWLPENIAKKYEQYKDVEVLLDLEHDINDLKMQKIELKNWYKKLWLPPMVNEKEAIDSVDKLLKFSLVTSSSSKQDVFESSVYRRILP